jgi:uncharacterized protein YqgC (DUF456 family)
MDWEQIVGLVLTLLVMGVGLVGCVMPVLPGPPLILAAAVGHRLWFGEHSVRGWVLGVLAALAVAALALDYLATLVGARKLGATWRGMVGAGLGVVWGVFTGPLGLVAGPLLGATLGEWLGGRELRTASRAGLGAVLGVLAGAAGKFACALAMIGLFVANLAWRS